MTRREVRFGATVKHAPSPQAWRDQARRIESLGYSSLLVGDHIRNQWGPLVGLTVAAEATDRLRIGINVLNNDLRNPVVLAQELATLDVVSGGRVEVGVGAGYSPADYRATGVELDPAATRVERLGEAVRIMKDYWASGRVDFAGAHYTLTATDCYPRTVSVPGPAVCIGGSGPRLLGLAAREADIVSISPSFSRAGVDAASARSATMASFAEKAVLVRSLASSRPTPPELHLSVLWAGVGGRAASVRYQLGHEFGLSDEEISDCPVALIGSVAEVCDKIAQLSETLGVSYLSVADPIGFAPVVERLAGRPLTYANVKAMARSRAGRAVRGAQARLRRPAPPPVPALTHRVLMVGVGGMGEKWIRKYLPRFADRVEFAGLVDVSADALEAQGSYLGVPQSRRFTSIDAAFAALASGRLGTVDASFVVVPPAVHVEVIEAAAGAGLDVLCEKPIAENWHDCLRAYHAAVAGGIKAQIVQNYRYWRHMRAARDLVASGRFGDLVSITARFAMDFRERNSWGAPFRHEMAHALLLEGAVHHLDSLRYLADADVATVQADDWRPPTAAGFDGECCAFAIGTFANGARFSYEGNAVAAGTLDPWGDETFRIECADASVVVSAKSVHVARATFRGVQTEPVALPPLPYLGHEAVIAQFLDWRELGRRADTHILDNMATAAALFATLESSSSGRRVEVGSFLERL